MSSFDVTTLREDFPILSRLVRNGKKLIYLDSGATSQKPRIVIDAEREFYFHHNSAVHRGAHLLAEEATDAFEGARSKVANFLNVDTEEIIFTKSATESINIVSYGFLNSSLGVSGKLDKSSPFFIDSSKNIVVSELEHHANLLPWQHLAEKTGAQLRWLSVTEEGRLDLSNLESVVDGNTAVVAITHQSNVTGAITDLAPITARARKCSAIILLDACQSVPHMIVDISELDIDFLAFSGHKALGPTGVGILWGASALLKQMPPMLTGGSMIESATISTARYAAPPKRFEAGVPNMAQAVGLGAAIDYLTSIGMNQIHAHESALTQRAIDGLSAIPGLSIVGPKDMKLRGGALSFTVEGIHPHDLGQVLDDQGIAVRTGHHCAWPLMQALRVQATTRASFYLYNTFEEIDQLVSAVIDAKKFFKV
jgi:cysteine desulfurase/selenocysteine lyase